MAKKTQSKIKEETKKKISVRSQKKEEKKESVIKSVIVKKESSIQKSKTCKSSKVKEEDSLNEDENIKETNIRLAPLNKLDITKNKDFVLHNGCIIDPEILNSFPNVELVEDKLKRFNGNCYDVTLNYTNVSNNNNKFYKMQTFIVKNGNISANIKEEFEKEVKNIEDNNKLNERQKKNLVDKLKEDYNLNDSQEDQFYVFFRWGRVGANGQVSFTPCADRDAAIKTFVGKLISKTKSGYKYIPLKYDSENLKEEDNKMDVEKESKDEIKTSVDIEKEVKELLVSIFSIKVVDEYVREINYDCSKLPLGLLSQDVIKKGYTMLSEIEEILKVYYENIEKLSLIKRGGGTIKINTQISLNKNQIQYLSSQYYSIIPHNFGYQNIMNFVLDTKEKLINEIEFLNNLKEIQINSKIVDKIGNTENNTNNSNVGSSLEDCYRKIKYNLEPIKEESSRYEQFKDVIKNNNLYNFNLDISLQKLFKISNKESIISDNSKKENTESNKKLLWYGSKTTNYANILTNTFPQLSKDAPVTGTLFGRGIYFNDIICKSIGNCFCKNNEAIILLCEVDMGKEYESKQKDPFVELKLETNNCTSVRGIGQNQPCNLEEEQKHMLGLDNINENTEVPLGDIEFKTDIKSYLAFNEYVVYDSKNIDIKYLLVVKAKNNNE